MDPVAWPPPSAVTEAVKVTVAGETEVAGPVSTVVVLVWLLWHQLAALEKSTTKNSAS